jgi:NAD(P)-dependent dehydrogenase (short-subunit alcohol dehydrogenase family)
MVILPQVRQSNSLIPTTHPTLTAVFIGATAGIGSFSLKAFAAQVPQPRIYFTGRNQSAGNTLLTELKTLNPKGEYIFLPADTSLLNTVDDICRQIKEKEKSINVLFLSQGTLKFGTRTEEGLHYAMAVTYYARIRFILNLLPLVRAAEGLKRVVNVAVGTKEGAVFADDWQGYKIPFSRARGHLASIITLAQLALRERAPDVGFVHDFPGAVKTGLLRGDEGLVWWVMKAAEIFVMPVSIWMGKLPGVGAGECGERHVYLCTSGRYPGRDEEGHREGNDVAAGVDGKAGSGVYSVDWDGESAGTKTVQVMKELVKDGMVEKLWDHTMKQFAKVTGCESI